MHAALTHELLGQQVKLDSLEREIISLEAQLTDNLPSTNLSKSARLKHLIAFVYDTLKMEPVFRRGYPEDYLLPSILQRRQAACMGLSSLFLTLGNSLELDLKPVFLPGHVFLRMESEGEIINVETLRFGLNREDEFYRNYFHLHKRRWHDLSTRNETQFLAGLIYNFGNALREQGYPFQAMKAYQVTEKYLPNFPEALGNLAILYMENGKRDSAEILFAKVLRNDSLSVLVLENLGEMAWEEENWGKAASIFEKLSRHFPKNSQYRLKWRQSMQNL